MLKNIVLILIATLLAISCNNTSKENSKTTVPEVIKTVEFKIDGMTCTGCENTVQNSVGNIKGVKTVKADYQAGNAIITYDSASVSIDTMKQTILDKGYEITGVYGQ